MRHALHAQVADIAKSIMVKLSKQARARPPARPSPRRAPQPAHSLSGPACASERLPPRAGPVA